MRGTPQPNRDADFDAWLLGQVEALRNGRFNSLDWGDLAEELEAMAARHKSELRSRVQTLLEHLLKLQYQPDYDGARGWKLTANRSRDAIEDLFEESPSLRTRVEECVAKAYERARRDAIDDTGLGAALFPMNCPWTVETFTSRDFWPSPSNGPLSSSS